MTRRCSSSAREETHRRRSAECADVASGEWLCLLSDGVLECENAAGEMFGDARLEEALDRACTPDSEPTRVTAELLDTLDAWRGTHPRDDDQTLLVLRARGDV